MTHLKPKQHYIDRYDKNTIEECRRITKRPKNQSQASKIVKNVLLYITKGERAINKDETISKWMEYDEKKDKMLKKEPKFFPTCLNCSIPMKYDIKELYEQLDSDKLHIKFFFVCPNCRSYRIFLENNKEYIPEKPKCPECNTVLLGKVTRKNNKQHKHISYCTNCNYKDSWNMTLKPTMPKVDLNLSKDRRKYCLTEKETLEYSNAKFDLEACSKLLEEHEKTKKKNNQLKNP
ncbi:MAG: hypothetical protein PHR39_01060 [Actinomycetota bacterium]|nr:hypothetical protein [Actinomycetota bacterium]